MVEEKVIFVPQSREQSLRISARKQSLLVFAAVAVVFLLALVVAWLFPIYLTGPGETGARRLDTGWSYLQGGAEYAIDSLPRTIELDGDTLVLRRSLTQQELNANHVLTLRTHYASVRAWADDVLIYEAAQGEAQALGSMWHFIPMEACLGAETLTVEFRVYSGGTYPLESVLLDTPGAVQYTLIRENGGPIFFSFVCMFLAVIILLCAAVLVRWKSQMYLPMLALALFILLSGLWILLDSKITTIGGGNFALSYFLSYAAFYLLMVPCLLYIRLMLSSTRRALNVLIWAFLINAAVCLALHTAGLVQLHSTAVVVHVLILLTVPVTTGAFWHSVVHLGDRQLRFSFLGLLAVYVCGFASIALYHAGLLRTANNTSLYILGLSILLAGMVTDAITMFGRFWRQKEDMDRYRRLAVEDSMTDLGNRNAFQLYLTHLQKIGTEQISLVLFDVDDLKRINDQLGHHVGDQAIYTAAQCIRRVFAAVGDCFRIGGDEFAVVITGKAALRVPELLARFARVMKERWDMKLPSAGVSYGWAGSVGKETLTAERISQIWEDADRALYQNKREHKAGRTHEAAAP